MTTQLKSELRTGGRFAIVGAVATLTHLGMAQALLGIGLASAGEANVVGFLVALITGLTGHYYYTFERRGTYLRAAWRYGLIALSGFFVNNVVLFLLVTSKWLGESESLAIAIIIVPAGTFVASRLWGFVATHDA